MGKNIKLTKERQEELKWLNSKGHSIVKVKCTNCGKLHETVVENVVKNSSLKNDSFLCGDC